jgi:F0F1-type ATP synthase membrane subunit b/b'
MDWTTIIVGLLSGTTVGGIIEAIRYRRQNIKIKDSEATQSNVEAQKSEIDLANKYRDEMLNMVQMVKDANEKNFTNQDEIIKSLRRLDERMEQMEIKVGDIESYLNGPYHQYVAEKQSRYNPNTLKNDNSSMS